MASADLRDELICSICLHIYTDPVTLRCGHNFCQTCIANLMDIQEEAGVYTCPECREDLQERPVLRKNTALSNITQRFHSLQLSPEEANSVCVYCMPSQVPAVICCQHCKAFLCDHHLQFHSKSPKHVSSEPTTSLEYRKCSVHQKVLEFFCPVDAACLCATCKQDCELNGHHTQSLDDVAKSQKETLRKVLEKLSFKSERAEEKIQSLKRHDMKIQAQARSLIRRLNTMKIEVQVLVNKVQSDVSRQAEHVTLSVSDLVKDLEIEMDVLYSKMDHVWQLREIIDPILVLQKSEESYFYDIETEDDEHDKETYALGDLDEGRILQTLHVGLSSVMNIVQKSNDHNDPTDLLLDINTASNNLHIAKDLKTISWSEERQNRPEMPQRFQTYQVLSINSFSSGRHHWEVEMSRSSGWVVGVCYPSIERKGELSVIGSSSKSWGLWGFKDMFFMRHDCKHTHLHHNVSCHRVRIDLDYEAGQLAFYEMGDPIRHLHTFTATFTEPLHAAFWVRGVKNREYRECTVRIRGYEKVM
ncbi:E3 ubiquitin/ISG15 ligase TRIM25-like [Dendropsophus ebraccatus]|uniref:E3 ubiquitin/ISG15 ligase TRIM25-like n=1 Tax=Dendropsophus ebraccatus TaxID=150705 RepID=UPI003831A527